MSSSASLGGSARLPSLDGARGLLAVVVVIAHFSAAAAGPNLIPFARFSVLGFFFISSYSLTVSWRAGDYPGYVVKRLVRLWPCYAAALAFGGALTGISPSPGEFVWLPYSPSWAEHPQAPVVWSLYVEVYASLAMPLVVAAGGSTRKTVAASSGLFALSFLHHDFLYGVFFVVGAWMALRIRLDAAVLNGKLLQELGAISYPLYLFHVPIIMMLKAMAPDVWRWAALPACFAAAAALRVLLEEPAKQLSRRVGRWSSSRQIRRTVFAFALPRRRTGETV